MLYKQKVTFLSMSYVYTNPYAAYEVIINSIMP